MADPVRAVVAAEHPVLRGVIDSACRDAHVTVVAKVETAAATIDACRASRPDLLILDLDLPDADGLRVLADLGEDDRPGAVLVLSDHAEGDVVLRSLRLGARGYVTKAEGLRDLAETLRRVLDGERAIAPALEQDAVLALGRFRAARARGRRGRGGAHRTRATGAGAPGRRSDDAADRDAAGDLAADRRDARGQGLPEARRCARASRPCPARQRWGSWSCSLGRAPADSEEWRHPAATTRAMSETSVPKADGPAPDDAGRSRARKLGVVVIDPFPVVRAGLVSTIDATPASRSSGRRPAPTRRWSRSAGSDGRASSSSSRWASPASRTPTG